LREEYCWLVAGGWFVVREKYCWLVADKPSKQGADSFLHACAKLNYAPNFRSFQHFWTHNLCYAPYPSQITICWLFYMHVFCYMYLIYQGACMSKVIHLENLKLTIIWDGGIIWTITHI
jgi:hypothetical protein